MITCKDCFYKTKNVTALNAYECSYQSPVAVPIMAQNAAGQVVIGGIAGIRPPVMDNTAACGQYRVTPPAPVVSIR